MTTTELGSGFDLTVLACLHRGRGAAAERDLLSVEDLSILVLGKRDNTSKSRIKEVVARAAKRRWLHLDNHNQRPAGRRKLYGLSELGWQEMNDLVRNVTLPELPVK